MQGHQGKEAGKLRGKLAGVQVSGFLILVPGMFACMHVCLDFCLVLISMLAKGLEMIDDLFDS